jgi:hypothetical protein
MFTARSTCNVPEAVPGAASFPFTATLMLPSASLVDAVAEKL